MKLYIDNGRSRYSAAAVMAALLLCYSATAQTVDEAWAASPATTDTQWAQANAAPVNPANSGTANTQGGLYTVAGACSKVNPMTGGYSCPSGFTPHVIYMDWYDWGGCKGYMNLYWCKPN